MEDQFPLNNFDPGAACRFILQEHNDELSQYNQLLAYNMLLAWALWPVDEAKKAIPRAAKVAVRTVIIDLLIKSERSFEASSNRYKMFREIKGHQVLLGLLQQLTISEFRNFRVYYESSQGAFSSLGGWQTIKKTMSDGSYRRLIRKQWAKTRTAAYILDYLLRCQFNELEKYATLNKAYAFIDEKGYGVPTIKGQTNIQAKAWRPFVERAPLLYILWRDSPEKFQLEQTIKLSSRRSRREILRNARSVLLRASAICRILSSLPSFGNANTLFFDPCTNEADASAVSLVYAPFPNEDIKK